MLTSRFTARVIAAFIAATAITTLAAATALAHPESEGDHPGGCIVTAEPGTIPVGGEFTVEGNFGGASIFVLPGADATPDFDETPDATTPPGDSFSVTFTHTGDPGDLTIVGFIDATECGDTDHITVTATLPNTASDARTDAFAAIAGLAMLGSAVVLGRRYAHVDRGRRPYR